jgi:glycosyltransferase involved in cell wall biosynthesis
MTVLFVGPLPEPTTGQSLACKVLLDELLKKYPVEVVDLNKKEFLAGLMSLGRVGEVLGIAWRIWRRRRRCKAIYFTIAESLAGNLKDLLIYVACMPQLSKTVIHLHGGAGMRRILSNEHRILRWINHWFLRRLGGVIVLGRRHLPLYQGVVAPQRLHVVANFAQDYLFVDAAAVDRKFAATRPLRILFLSNLLPGKGHEELVSAYSALEPLEREAVKLDFAGSFESAEDQARFLASIAPWPGVKYHGSVGGERKRRMFANAHVFCLPTYYPYEGQPISILEAYASGCAVITTDHSGIFDTFTDGVNGWAVAKRSVDSLRRTLQRAVASSAELHAIAQANLDMASREYRTSVYTDRLNRIVAGVHDASGDH